MLLDVHANVYMVLVQGLLVGDHKDLEIEAWYIWVHGGEFEIGTEEVPCVFFLKLWISMDFEVLLSKSLPFENRTQTCEQKNNLALRTRIIFLFHSSLRYHLDSLFSDTISE